jgi:hypothetical protein
MNWVAVKDYATLIAACIAATVALANLFLAPSLARRNEQSKWLREQQLRAYAGYLNAMVAYFNWNSRWPMTMDVFGRHIANVAGEYTVEQLYEEAAKQGHSMVVQMADYAEKAGEHYQIIRLIAPDDVVIAAGELSDTVRDLQTARVKMSISDYMSIENNDESEAFVKAMDRFIAAARLDVLPKALARSRIVH